VTSFEQQCSYSSRFCWLCSLAEIKPLGARVFRTVPDITYGDAHKSTGMTARLEEVHLPPQHHLRHSARSQRLLSGQIAARATSTRQQPRST
jgi:hypothetical protein